MRVLSTKRKFILFKFIYSFIVIIILIIGVEITVYMFYKNGKIRLATKEEIISMSKNKIKQEDAFSAVYIPHPYFGYVYSPNSSVSQLNNVSHTYIHMQSNSEGFIDREFPTEKKEGLCIYGLLGGSAAMSWGVEDKEDSISYQLEKLLNTYLINDRCKEYRVLNMGVGSHTFYQSMQIYLYYKNLLDGVIFYGGFNEAAQGAMLINDDPVQFPIINMYASLKTPSPLIALIYQKNIEINKIANFLLKYPFLINLSSVRFFFGLKLQEIEQLHRKLQLGNYQAALPGIKGKFKKQLQSLFPSLTPLKFLQSYDNENPDIPKLIEKILPIVFTEPILNAYLVKPTNVKFLSVIQPLMYITGQDTKWKDYNFASYYFQEQCVEKCLAEAKKLEAYGIKTYNLNEINRQLYRKDMFIDQVHLKKEGTKIVAQTLFEIIKEEWDK